MAHSPLCQRHSSASSPLAAGLLVMVLAAQDLQVCPVVHGTAGGDGDDVIDGSAVVRAAKHGADVAALGEDRFAELLPRGAVVAPGSAY